MTITGIGAAEGVEEVEGPPGEGVDQVMGQRPDLGRQRVDPAAGEGAQDQRAQPRMARRLQFQHGMRLDRVERGEAVGDLAGRHGLAPEAPVTQERVDRRVGRGHGHGVVGPEDQRVVEEHERHDEGREPILNDVTDVSIGLAPDIPAAA
jgi:hypothetical protein